MTYKTFNCRQCKFWLEKESWVNTKNGTRVIEWRGNCRKRPPSASHGWPVVMDSDWCGEFHMRVD